MQWKYGVPCTSSPGCARASACPERLPVIFLDGAEDLSTTGLVLEREWMVEEKKGVVATEMLKRPLN